MNTIVFYLTTPLQLISALNIIDANLQKKGNLYCILSDRLISKEIKERLASLQIFKKIFITPTTRPSLKKWLNSSYLKEIFPLESILRSSIYKTNYTFNEAPILFPEAIECLRKASDIYFHTDENSLISLCNNSCKRHLLDEGTRSYTQQSTIVKPDFIYLYEPDFADFQSDPLNTIKIPKISFKRENLISWINKIFPCEPLPHNNVFFDQPLGKHPYFLLSQLTNRSRSECLKFKARMSILKEFSDKQNDDFIVRLHPGTTTNQQSYLKRTFNAIKSSNPFEIELLNSHFSKYTLSTIYSSASCQWFLLFDSDIINTSSIQVNIYLPLFIRLSNSQLDRSILNFFIKVKNKLPCVTLI